MTHFYQRTLCQTTSCQGIGVHSGQNVELTFHPAPIDFGIWFKRTDVDLNIQLIPALWNYVSDTKLCTTLENKYGIRLGTVEHVLAALSALKISNVLIEVNGPEIPILDGSSQGFIHLFEKIGIQQQSKFQKFIKILDKIQVDYKGENLISYASLEPSTTHSLSYDFKPRYSKKEYQNYTTTNIYKTFSTELSAARTFGYMEDVKTLLDLGLAKGASLDNALVFDGNTVVNPEGSRFDNECARHKALDVIGDLALAGFPIQGHFHGHQSGHSLNNQLLKALFRNTSAWALIDPNQEYSKSNKPIQDFTLPHKKFLKSQMSSVPLYKFAGNR